MSSFQKTPDYRIHSFVIIIDHNASSSVGRYCEYQQSTEAAAILDSCGSQADYTAALAGFCKTGSVGVLEWTPDENTPDTVYYQVCRFFEVHAKHQKFGLLLKLTDLQKVSLV